MGGDRGDFRSTPRRGVTTEGYPRFSMKFIEGQPIDGYCVELGAALMHQGRLNEARPLILEGHPAMAAVCPRSDRRMLRATNFAQQIGDLDQTG